MARRKFLQVVQESIDDGSRSQSRCEPFRLRLSVIRCEPLGEDFRCITRKFRNDHAQLNRDMNCLAVDNNCAQNQSNTPIQLRLASNYQAVSFHFAQFPAHPSADTSDLNWATIELVEKEAKVADCWWRQRNLDYNLAD